MTTATLEHKTIEERFQAFHETNPDVYRELVSIIRQAKLNGYRIGITAVGEQFRWRRYVDTHDLDVYKHVYKLNNDYLSRYARLIMQQEKDLEGFFETRELKS